MMKPKLPNRLASCLRDYFTDHLPRLRGMSPNTIHSYRDSLLLLLRFLAAKRKRQISDLDLDDIESDQVLAFLNYLEQDRNNGVPTRNVRLAAIHAFFRYVGAHHLDQIERAQRILGVPFKRGRQRAVEYLEHAEIETILSRIDRSSPDGRRDYLLLATMFNTGARVQEIIDLRARDLQLTRPYQLRLFGKGRKERFCPLWPQTAQVLREFCKERQIDLQSEARVFLNHRGEPLTRFGVRYILAKCLERIRPEVATLAHKRLHPHSIRHSTAVALLKSGVDLSTISQWLGHSSPSTTNRYATIDLDMKRQAIARVKPIPGSRNAQWRKNQTLLEWLEQL
jgi:site-specific recombinase XerD